MSTAALTSPLSPGRSRRTACLIDVLFACLLIFVLGPLMVIIAAAILLESGGPVFFVQQRLGQHGAPFGMIKFRKFRHDQGAVGAPLTAAGDRRLTRVGRILCASKLDELPQLWNLLRGEMALVGPRPESMPFADCLQSQFAHVLDHRPGLLGPSQVIFRNECALFAEYDDPAPFYRAVLLPAKARIDLAYYQTRTSWSDLRWIALGVLATLGMSMAVSQRELLLDGEPEVTRAMQAAGLLPMPGRRFSWL